MANFSPVLDSSHIIIKADGRLAVCLVAPAPEYAKATFAQSEQSKLEPAPAAARNAQNRAKTARFPEYWPTKNGYWPTTASGVLASSVCPGQTGQILARFSIST